MNKEEAAAIWNSILSDEDTILAFANACEKIGMEKARDATIDECNEYLSTDALLALKKVTR